MPPRWKLLQRGATLGTLGYLPYMLEELDPRPAREQFNERYAHGGGWYPFKGHRLNFDNFTLTYPGDPPMCAVAMTKLRKEYIVLFECQWVAIVQPDSSYEVARMD